MKFIVNLLCFLLLAACTASPPPQSPRVSRSVENFKPYIDYVNARFHAGLNKGFDPADRRPKLLLIGDSQANDFLNSVQENGYFDHYQIRTRRISSQCQIFLGTPQNSGVAKHLRDSCEEADNLQRMKQQINESDVVILSGLWRQWAIKELPNTIRNLSLRPSQKLVIVGRKSFGPVTMSLYETLSVSARVKQRNHINRRFLVENRNIANLLGPSRFIDQYSLICGVRSNTCPIFTPEGEFITYDGGHLTKSGAKHVGMLLLQSPALKKLL